MLSIIGATENLRSSFKFQRSRGFSGFLSARAEKAIPQERAAAGAPSRMAARFPPAHLKAECPRPTPAVAAAFGNPRQQGAREGREGGADFGVGGLMPELIAQVPAKTKRPRC